MHELAVMSSILESVERRAHELEADRIVAINLVVGQRSCVVDDSMLFYFDYLTPGTLAEGAELNIRRTRMSFACATCGDTYEPIGTDFRCPDCGEVGQVTGDGTELLIESMEIAS